MKRKPNGPGRSSLDGLLATTEIHAPDVSYVVLEATGRVGGKILSVPPRADGKALIDVSAAWVILIF